jgi:hypothetical protein
MLAGEMGVGGRHILSPTAQWIVVLDRIGHALAFDTNDGGSHD